VLELIDLYSICKLIVTLKPESETRP
jgi:hypothetical protein